MIELRRLSPNDGNDIYELLQLIPKDENGLINKANGLSFEEYKQFLGKKIEFKNDIRFYSGEKTDSPDYRNNTVQPG